MVRRGCYRDLVCDQPILKVVMEVLCEVPSSHLPVPFCFRTYSLFDRKQLLNDTLVFHWIRMLDVLQKITSILQFLHNIGVLQRGVHGEGEH